MARARKAAAAVRVALATRGALFYRPPVSLLLRVAAIYSLGWAIALFWPGLLPGAATASPAFRSLAHALAIANLAFAVLCWAAARAPAASHTIIATMLMVFGLRAALGTWEVLYTLDGPAAVLRLIDMVLTLAAFVGLLNLLPGIVPGGRDRAD